MSILTLPGVWLRNYPKVSLKFLGRTDFFPPLPTQEELGKMREICIGTKTKTIGDALVLSTLPGRLKATYPKLKITTYPKGFNPVVFANNPHVQGLDYLPNALYGDDANWGSGHLIQAKEQYFGFTPTHEIKPRIYLTQAERDWAKAWCGSKNSKKKIVLHPWGHTWTQVAGNLLWSQVIKNHSEQFDFWQVGVEGQQKLEGCTRYALFPKASHHARKLFALIEQSDYFIGVNSGPMHVARAFDKPSLILTQQKDAEAIFRERRERALCLNHAIDDGFLYEANQHLSMPAEVQSFTNRFDILDSKIATFLGRVSGSLPIL